jgi:peroxiredoxin
MLDDSSCQLDEKHQALFEQYRKMAIGKTAPDIVFSKEVKGYAKLSDIKSKYKVVVFGASWCNKCAEELPKLKPYYENWKKTDDVEVVFISLDQDETVFSNFTTDFPWVSSCDYKSWEGQAAKDYCVFATPTMYLLDNNQKVVAKPVSAEHLESILQMYRGSESK